MKDIRLVQTHTHKCEWCKEERATYKVNMLGHNQHESERVFMPALCDNCLVDLNIFLDRWIERS